LNEQAMKTVLLFSSIFYMLGMKAGNTIEILKRVIVPVKSIISAPVPNRVPAGKSYFYKPEGTSSKKEVVEKKSDKSSSSASTPAVGTPGQKQVKTPVQ